jgi:hypothetical protein
LLPTQTTSTTESLSVAQTSTTLQLPSTTTATATQQQTTQTQQQTTTQPTTTQSTTIRQTFRPRADVTNAGSKVIIVFAVITAVMVLAILSIWLVRRCGPKPSKVATFHCRNLEIGCRMLQAVSAHVSTQLQSLSQSSQLTK